ncbi:sensor histidine kinase [Halomonas huangheensis]|uniref:histidine kinase n=1 Tax=Halomonas huangheensis TaxID=1178482 RepID=W1N325_9GAMM|nr:sensor histidine kinase [Halomonas huangheensis]ALM51453.1 histidine kinase [Halomonas huangheensis]ERL49908.1 hypothetical protein BJB45_01945 [Halomonas huangheensis]
MITVTRSIKWRMALWLLISVLGLGALLMLEAWQSSRQAAERAFDAQLAAAALTISEAVQWRDGVPEVIIPPAALQILATSSEERVFYAVLDADGRQLSSNWPQSPVPEALQTRLGESRSTDPVVVDQSSANGRLRLYGREVSSAGWVDQQPVQVWVGHTLSGREQLSGALFRQAVSRFLAMVVLAGVLMALTIRYVLAPLRRLRHQLRLRDADDMRPLEAQVPREIRELAETLNHLFARQRQGREDLLRFTADASHQLKTPLAGLQTTSELALRSDDPARWREALDQVHDSAARTSRLAGQLLSLARLRHIQGDSRQTPLELTALVREVALDWAGREQARHHDLGLEPLPPSPVMVVAEDWALRELLGNLLDNALHYTPAGSHISLKMYCEGNEVCLAVQDDGPGVAAEALERLSQPFERGGRQDTEGSGLGLAIVETIAQRLGGRIRITNQVPTGLSVALWLPGDRMAKEQG